MATIGFIGLGNMGAPMAANLQKAQHRVAGFDIAAQAMTVLAEIGHAEVEGYFAPLGDRELTFA